MNKPKLRYVEAFPVEVEGQRLVCLRDPQNLSGKMIFLPTEALYIVSLFDGKHTVLDIQESFMRQFGRLVFRDEIEKLTSRLDESLFLDSEKYRDFRKKFEEEFINSRVRESSHAGLSYPHELREIEKWLDDFFEKAGESYPKNSGLGEVRGLISPHIDLRRGGRSYALAYRELANACESDTFIIFGTSHYADVENPFILSKKIFRTPFGEVETDTEFVEKLIAKCNWNLFEGEIFHRQEHSIEFQIVFLQYLFREKRRFRIVPILCNSFFRMIQNGHSPQQDQRVSSFLGAIEEAISTLGNRAFVIAGADLAHVGLKFGDRNPVNESKLRWIKERDLVSLTHAESLDAERFFDSIKEEKDERKICGLSPIYALLSTINAKKGKLLDYDQALEPDTGSVVSFASVGFYS